MSKPKPANSEKSTRNQRGRSRRPRRQPLDIAERSHIWQALLESEDRYRATFDFAPVGIMHTKLDSDRILRANPKLAEMLGYTEIELLGMTTDDILHPDHVGSDRPRYRERMLSGELGTFSSERRFVRKDGSVIWVNRTVSLARDPLGKALYFIRIVEDVTARKQAEAALERLARARYVQAECNRVLVHAVDESAMLEQMCRAVVETGGYRLAWVGFATGDPARPLRSAAHAGFGSDSPMSGSIAWGADGCYQGFMRDVITTGTPHIARNILGDPMQARRRARAMQHGFQSSIALPLRKEDELLGAIAIYSGDPDAFYFDEISLLTGLADDIAFGIVSQRERRARQHAEAAQREIEQRLTLALEGSGQALFDWNVVTGEVFISPKWNEMLGGNRTAVLTTIEELGRLVHPDDLGNLNACLVDSLKHDTLYRAEHRVRNRSGDWTWIQSHGKVTARDERGRALRLVGYNTDITPRKLAEVALAESEERFRATFEQAAVGIHHVDLSGVLLHVNQKFCGMLGYGRAELVGRTIKDITHPDDFGRGTLYREKLMHGTLGSVSGEKRFLRKDGSVLWARRTMSAACDKGGKPQYVISIIEDISEHKQLEHRFRDTFEQAAVGIGHVGFDGRFRRVNRKFHEITGYSEQELIGTLSSVISHPEDIGTGSHAREQLLAGEIDSFANEKRYLRKDGTTIWVNRTESLARDDSGQPLYFIRVIEDITARKEAEERYRATFENAPVGIMHTSVGDDRILHSNLRLSEMLGYEPGELIGMVVDDIRHPDGRGANRRRNYDRVLRGELATYSSERMCRRKDGSPLWVNRTVSLVRDADGKPLYFISMMEDINDRRRALEAAARERVLLRTIIDTVPENIYVKDAQGRFMLANRTWLRARGSVEQDIAGKTVYDFFAHDMAEKMAVQDAEVIRTGMSMPEREQRIILNVSGEKQAEDRWAAISKVPMRDPSGNIVGTVGISRDITERKRTEEALRASEERFRATFDSAPAGIMHTAIEEDRILQANPKLCEMLGYTRDELLRMGIDDIIHPDQLGTDRRKYRDKMLSGAIDSYSSERKYLRKDGSTLWVNRIVSLAKDTAGKPLYFNRIIEDITERVMSTRRRAMEHDVTQALAESATVEAAMQRVLRIICQALDWTCGIYWKWAEDDELLRCAETWHADAAGVPEFVAASMGRPNEAPAWHGAPPPAVGGGIVRRVWLTGAPVWFPDVMSQPDFRRGAIAARADLRSAFGFPILSGVQPVGVMEFYSREIRQPDEALLQIVQAIGSQIGQFIQRNEAERALRTSEERYRDVFEASPLPMWVWDDETLDIVAVNRAATLHYGYSREEFLRMNVRDFWEPGEVERYERNIHDRVRRQSLQLQRKHLTKDGRVIDTEVTARLFTLDGRQVWFTVINDVSVRVRAEAALRESEEQFRQLAGNIPQVFWITDTSHRQTLYVSPAAESMLGRPLQDILSDPRGLVRAVHKEDRPRVYAARKKAVESGYDEIFRIVRPDGSTRWVHDRAFPVRDAAGRVYRIAGIAEDVTDRKHAEERLEHLAHYDVMTNLPNRVLFYDRLRHALVQAKRNRWTMGIMFIDVDRFKNVNDTLGHAVGDTLLQQIAERLTHSVRSGDTVGRLGGDEFSIVLSTLASPQDANIVAQKIMTAFNEPFRLEGTEVYVTASIGITLYPDDSSDLDVLIKNADAAMYRAKELGRNSYQFYTPEMNAGSSRFLGMESGLRHALERNEFLMHYQPKASIVDGDITGLEALLRWNHPERGLVSPAEFIPLLEETGYIVQVGEWVLQAVCTQIKAWQRAGVRPVPVAVNLSARQFAAKDLGPTIRRILEEHQVDPGLIEFEITESSLMANTEEAARTLEYLDRLGAGLSIDDFGTGYSSLGYLKRFPLSALKIDRSFVRDITSDGDDATITRAVISMAHNLGLKVIAEGVETRAQLEFLAEYGCNEIQGYYFSRPMAAEDCAIWVQERRRLEQPGPASDAGVPVVLLLDDDEEALANIQRILARDGYRILSARDAREGLALLRDHRVDVVVSDQNMPGMSGVDFLQCVQSLSPKTMRILATGYADFHTMTAAINKGGIFRCLSKDFTDEVLRASVREAVQVRARITHDLGTPPGMLES